MSKSYEVSYLRPPWSEGGVFTLLLAAVVVVWLVALDGLSLGWDTLNHHVYLGWMAVQGDRLGHDVFAAGSMSCQYPYSYAPLFWLQQQGATGREAALALALPAVAAVPAIWLTAWVFWPERGLQSSLARGAFTALAFMSPLWWSLLDSTSNDIISTLPIVWACALVVWRSACDWAPADGATKNILTLRCSAAWMALSGALVGVALMLKISHVFAALGLAIVALASANGIRLALARLACLTLGGGLVALLLWWPWARGVWVQCGSPIYPMLTDVLRPWAERLP